MPVFEIEVIREDNTVVAETEYEGPHSADSLQSALAKENRSYVGKLVRTDNTRRGLTGSDPIAQDGSYILYVTAGKGEILQVTLMFLKLLHHSWHFFLNGGCVKGLLPFYWQQSKKLRSTSRIL